MKRCPKCQKEFPDTMRFCQTDGTPLVEASAPSAPEDPFKTVVGQPHEDPFKTVVGGPPERSKDDDILQLPEEKPRVSDPMKTMVVSPEDWKKEESAPSAPPPFEPPPPPPKFEEPGLSPPAFGDLSSPPPRSSGDLPGSGGFGGSSSLGSEPKPFEPPKESPFGQPPSGAPFGSSPFEPPPPKTSFEPPSSPFDEPKPSPFDAPKPPPFKEPESPFGSGQPSPFSPPPSPFGSQQPASDPFGGAQAQAEWNPPPAPVQSWQDQGLGANTPFQPPAPGATGGQNQTLAIVSLVCGILSVCFCGVLTGIPAIITGFMAKNNADQNPAEYGGRGMALAGMITGAVGTLLGILGIIYYIIVLSQMR